MSGYEFKCPRCGSQIDLRASTKDQALLDIISMQSEFMPHSRLVFEYAELFETTRPLKPLKLLRVLTEIREIWNSGKFSFQRRTLVISREGMVQAIRTVCNKSFSAPLETHNYLKKVMLSVCEEEAKKRAEHDEKERQRKEAMLRAGRRDEPGERSDGAVNVGEIMKKMPWRQDDVS